MSYLPYELDADDPQSTPLGLIVLQTDETIEPEFSAYFSDRSYPIYVSRIPSGSKVTTDTLSEMEQALPAAADLLPKVRPYRVVGYGCTSASSVIGSKQVERLVQKSCDAAVVTNPLRAGSACAAELGVSKFALLSPYIEEVNEPLRRAFAENGVSMEVFGSFGEAQESRVVRISRQSIVDAALKLGSDSQVEAVFISCTNIRTFDAIPEIQKWLQKPVLSSNQSLAWHMRHLNSA